MTQMKQCNQGCLICVDIPRDGCPHAEPCDRVCDHCPDCNINLSFAEEATWD